MTTDEAIDRFVTHGSRDEILLLLADVRRGLEHWANWDKAYRDRAGGENDGDGHIMCVPPHWPTRNTLRYQAAILARAEQLIGESS